MKTKLIPFAMTPKGLTTKGKAREIARANYELEGIELKKAVAKIECDTDEDKAKAETKVELQEGVITQSEADKRDATVDKKPWVDVKKMDVNVSSNHPSCDNTYLVSQLFGSNKSVEITWRWFPCHRQSYASQVL